MYKKSFHIYIVNKKNRQDLIKTYIPYLHIPDFLVEKMLRNLLRGAGLTKQVRLDFVLSIKQLFYYEKKTRTNCP